MIAKIESDSELVKFDYNNKKNQLDKSKISIGTKASMLLKIFSDDARSVYVWCKKFFNKSYRWLT